MHGLLTNKFNIQLDHKAIDNDFDIFIIKKNGKEAIKVNVLDMPSEKYNALAVNYVYPQTCFVLYPKNTIDDFDFRNDIQKNHKNVTVQKFNISESNDYDREIAQLLINSLKCPKSQKFTYNNLTGGLYYFNSEWRKRNKEKKIYMFYGLEISITPEMLIDLSVITFKLNNESKETGYVIDKKSGFLRKLLKKDEKGDKYIIGGNPNKKNTIEFFSFKNIDSFNKCKLGVLYNFLEDVNEQLSKYIKFTPEYIGNFNNFELSKAQKKASENKILSRYINKPLLIIDTIKDKQSQKLASEIIKELKKSYNIDASISENLDNEAFNIRIIHDDDYYEINQLPDPHDEEHNNCIIQHITYEIDIEKGEKITHVTDKILQELAIKSDIINGNITVFDWKSLNTQKEWNFVTRKLISKTDSEKIYKYSLLKISNEGNITFYDFRDNEKSLNTDYKRIITFYEISNSNAKLKHEYVEGLFFSDIDNIHAIIRTPLVTMPNIKEIHDNLEKSRPEKEIEKDLIISAINDFENSYPEFLEYADYLKKETANIPKIISQDKLKKTMKYSKWKNSCKEFNRFFNEKYDILIMPETKSQDFDDHYMISNILDIKYYYNNDEMLYFVGTKRKALNLSANTACHIRKVISQNENIEFSELLQLMAVEFVRNKQYTVLPFPFKYLREHI